MHERTIAELSRALAAGGVSSVELTEALLDRIEALDERYNAFISVTREAALEQARAADTARAEG
ncbi:MAG: amidase family protein, partial [Halofilum sp. (in: g-proteobacteria)]|nr:amidase family protein [Halofilum sp. (in: g-proteobacteria)]